MGQLKKPS